jgi:hypothetical protein
VIGLSSFIRFHALRTPERPAPSSLRRQRKFLTPSSSRN